MRLDVAFRERAHSLESRERRWTQELVFGTMRLRGRIDHLLDRQLKRGLSSVSRPLADVLRLGAYQLLYMDSVPAFAAVSQAVDQARRLAGEGAASLTNGVLRNVARAGAEPALFPDPASDPEGYLTTWGSHPAWLVKRWLKRWPLESVTRLVELDNRRPSLHLRPLGIAEGVAIRRLAECGIAAEGVGAGTGCLRLEAGAAPARALAAIPAVVQDPGAALVVTYAAPRPGMRVADLCAAPGGKALALAETAAYVVASDISAHRLGLVAENAGRLGRRLDLVVASAHRPPFRSVDMVLLDVPCTGTGTLRRHPDARWRLEPGSVDVMVRAQESLLEGAAGVVAPGGLLVYSTCTLEAEENEDQVERFLERHREFRLEPGADVDGRFLSARGYLQVMPQDTGFDGAFAARLRRAA